MGGFFSELIDMFFPPRCTFCCRFLKEKNSQICSECEKTLPLTGEDNRLRGEFFSVCIAPLYYKDNVSKAVKRFKFSGKSHYARPFGDIMAEAVRQNLAGEYDLITWVPLSRKRYRKRGYSQAELLAMSVAFRLDEVAADVLEKTKDTPAQSSLKGRARRKANVSGTYGVKEKELVKNKRILIIDDIITTGATLSECARVLLNAGAKKVMCAVLCRVE
ncbi:MAG: ComF family protein [Clostridiales bacterium]|jgi:competence protein ComFC|nr:ComF family protein [Clostridiales bacterium]